MRFGARGLVHGRPHAISGVARNGGMAELVTVDSRAVHLLPEGLSIRDATWTEPLAVAVRAVWHGQVAPGMSVAVLGAGAIGQPVLVALNAGAGCAAVVETSPFRRELAAACGASAVLKPAEFAAVDRLFDVVFDCTGARWGSRAPLTSWGTAAGSPSWAAIRR